MIFILRIINHYDNAYDFGNDDDDDDDDNNAADDNDVENDNAYL